MNFPGSIYGPTGRNLDGTAPDLELDALDSYPHRSLVPDQGIPSPAQIWLLHDDANSDTIPVGTMGEALRLMLSGMSILILARELRPKADICARLLQALNLFTAPPKDRG